MKDKLNEYTWGIGLEHEMHIFHIPKKNTKEIVKDLILFDSESCIKRLLEDNNAGKIKLTHEEYDFLRKIPFELSGRVCNKKIVLERIPIQMPELITWQPFCSLKKKRNMINIIEELSYMRKKLFKLIKKDKLSKNLIKTYGDLDQHPFGMSRTIKYSKNIQDNKYIFEKEPTTKNDKVYTDYTGSYHVTLTLPYTEKTTEKTFLKMHQNFANQLQWLEPLLLTGFFTGDEYAPGSIKDRTNGSFRVMIVGWGNIAGSDIRLFDKGLGRYAKTQTYWRDNFKLYESDKIKPCLKPSPKAQAEDAITTLSTDFRTFGNDPITNERISGAPMKKPNGIEFRIFDQFHSDNLYSLVLFIILVAENSRKYETKEYVYKNKCWIDTVHNIMKNGYSALISNDYIKLLEKNLHLKIDCPSNVACDVFNNIFKILYDKNINGLWTKLFFGITTQKEFKYTQLYFKKVCVNKDAWNFALLMKLNRNKELLQKFKEILNNLKLYKLITIEEFNKIIKIHLEKSWLKDTYKILYFFRNFNILERIDINIYMIQNKTINDILKMTNVNKILFREYFYPAIGINILNNNINL